MIQPLEEVLKYHNRSIIERFLHHFPMPIEEAEQIFLDCKRYLWLAATMEERRLTDPDTPDIFITEGIKIVDEMWHAFIIYTELYERFCKKYLGRFIHHPPTLHKYNRNVETLGKEKSVELLVGEMVECTYELLGEETAIRWFDTYFKYNNENMMH